MPSLKLPRLRRQTTPPPPPTEPDFNDYEDDEDGHGARMGLFEHLDELRMRFFRAAVALVVGTLIGIALAGTALDYLRTPYCQVVALNDAASSGETLTVDDLTTADSECEFVILGPTGGVVAYFRVSLMIGAALAIPMITYQFLMFVMPGLKRKEKRVILMALPAITVLFVIGTAFAWFVLMPPALGFLEGFQQNLFRSEWTADLYLSSSHRWYSGWVWRSKHHWFSLCWVCWDW